MNDKLYTYKELQELLPDYIFGKLEESEATLFETSIIQFDDLQEEVTQGKAVFSRLDKMEIEKNLRDHSKNLSVKVNTLRSRRTLRQKRVSLITRFVMPALSIGVLAVFMMTPFGEHFLSNQKDFTGYVSPSIPQYLSADDIANLSTSSVTDNTEDYLNTNSYSEDTDLSQSVEEEMLDAIENSSDETVDLEMGEDYDILLDMNQLNESDFKIILQELDNEKSN